MSEEEYYDSNPSVSPSQTPSTTANEYNYDNNESDAIFDDYFETHYVVYQQVEQVPVLMPKPTKKVVWKKPYSNVPPPKPRKRPAVVQSVGEAPPDLEFCGECAPPPKQATPLNETALKQYLDSIEKRGEAFEPKARPQNADDDKTITERLENYGNCNVSERRCTFPTCGRRFIALEVLAFHMGYAHQSFSSKREGPHICMVCGSSFKNGKGKLAHMSSAHKRLAAQHERTCLLQGPICLAL